MQLVKGLVKRVAVTVVTAAMTLPGMAVGAALAADGSMDGWIKVCRKDDKLKKEICQTMSDLRSTDGQFLATFQVMEMTGEARRMARVILPTGLLLQPGLKLQIDQAKPEDAKFTVCAPDGCVSEMLITDQQFAALKKGKTLVVGVQGQAANPVSFTFPLDTFKTANEGAPLTADQIKVRAEAIKADIDAKRNSLEDQLVAAQKKALENAQQGQ